MGASVAVEAGEANCKRKRRAALHPKRFASAVCTLTTGRQHQNGGAPPLWCSVLSWVSTSPGGWAQWSQQISADLQQEGVGAATGWDGSTLCLWREKVEMVASSRSIGYFLGPARMPLSFPSISVEADGCGRGSSRWMGLSHLSAAVRLPIVRSSSCWQPLSSSLSFF